MQFDSGKLKVLQICRKRPNCKSSRGTGSWKAILLKIHRRTLTITSGPERTGPHQDSEGREANLIHPHKKKRSNSNAKKVITRKLSVLLVLRK